MDKTYLQLRMKGLIFDSDDDYDDNYEDDDEDEDEDEDGETSISISTAENVLILEKLSLGPKKKLLVLAVGGLLAHRARTRKKRIYKRPFCDEFLKFCFERFEVGIWSSATEENTNKVLNIVTEGLNIRKKFLFVLDQDDCTSSGTLENSSKPIFLKELKKIWDNIPKGGGHFSSSNTLLIENDPYKALFNPPNTAIFLPEYNINNVNDTVLGRSLQRFLDGLADASDVPTYVKQHPIGKPAITPSHPDWSYYSQIIEFDKEGASKDDPSSKPPHETA